MSNIYDQAYELERSVRDSDQFKRMTATYEKVMNDPEAKELFFKFRDTQLGIQEKQMSGQEVSESEMKEAQDVVTEIQQNALISDLIDAEHHLNTMFTEVSQIMTKPVEELYAKYE